MYNMGELKTQLKNMSVAKIFFTDLNGRIMTLPINPDNIETVIHDGIGFDGSSVAGYGSVDASDRILKPDPSTFHRLEFKDETLGFFIGDIYDDVDTRSAADPRAFLQKIIERSESEFGYQFAVGPEHEFFLVRPNEKGEPEHTDKAGYFLSAPYDQGEGVRNGIIGVLKSAGVNFEKSHHEVTPSQHEINLECGAPLKMADRTVLFNHVTHKVASQSGYLATFMPKPFDNYNRNAFHLHLSMRDSKGDNLFYDANAEFGLSRTARRFIAGIIKYARETSIIMASTFNSYKAYVIAKEAPVIRGWGLKNRSSMVRMPYCTNPASTRIELRSPDPAGNMYLQIGALIAMGLAGVAEELDCGAPDSGSTYNQDYAIQMWDERFLPRSLYEALVEAEKSEFLKHLLGDVIYDNYMILKRADWEGHRVKVSALEFEKYLNI